MECCTFVLGLALLRKALRQIKKKKRTIAEFYSFWTFFIRNKLTAYKKKEHQVTFSDVRFPQD